MSVTGDTAKYLDWQSAEVVHIHHKTPSAHSDIALLAVKREGEDGAETVLKHFPDHCRLDPFHLHPLHLLVKPGLVVKPEPI